ncbi:hypothetical protein F503_06001 [Ophiostoma piceae UAMH 11346]|uniref:Uncharacterized protein n=1 Tax=Ophiostoma piceae (strain UAMH 11346) TaxID=1262450 RepID=S3CFI9_OPHP1|nr:hypothetical protein F503_06001 [Ophiostoma piceae UAMH 11346]
MDHKVTSRPPSPPPENYYDYGPSLPNRPAGASSDLGRVNGSGSHGSQTGFDSVSLPILPKPGPPGPQSQYAQSPYPQPPASMVEIAPQPTMSTAGSVVAGGRPGPAQGPVGPPGPQGYQGYQGYQAYQGPQGLQNILGPQDPSGRPMGGYNYNYPPRPAAGTLTQSPGPMYAGNDTLNDTNTVSNTASRSDLKAARSNVEQGLARLIDLQRQQKQQLQYGPGAASVPNSTAAAIQEQLRLQTGSVVRDLRNVRRTIAGMAKAAENHRFRRWLIGGVLAVFVPLVRRLFRKPASARGTGTSGTEYAFSRSRALVDRMLNSVSRRGGLASIAFFVFAVLYIFTNEVSLRVARTLGRRLKKLSGKIERGDEELSEADIKQLAGWRWRVLLWGR